MVYITTMKDKDEMNAAWTQFFNPEDLPARATVAVAQLGPGTLIEVVATAAVDERAA
jgi:enamine deaminase RidA (YjgF/YER057c/UK114 family)